MHYINLLRLKNIKIQQGLFHAQMLQHSNNYAIKVKHLLNIIERISIFLASETNFVVKGEVKGEEEEEYCRKKLLQEK